jgi:hypothetical protein
MAEADADGDEEEEERCGPPEKAGRDWGLGAR